jgi:hypothetical protein
MRRAASLASEAAMEELKADLNNDISGLSAEVKKLKEERDRLFQYDSLCYPARQAKRSIYDISSDIHEIMSMKSRSGYPDSSMEVCIRDSSTHPTSKIQTQQVPLSSKLPPSPQEATSHDSTSTPRKTAWRTVDRKAQSNRLTATPSAPIPKAESHLLH